MVSSTRVLTGPRSPAFSRSVIWDTPEADDGLGASALWEFARARLGASKTYRGVRKNRKTAASDSWRLIADLTSQRKQNLCPVVTDSTSLALKISRKEQGNPGFKFLR